MSELNHIALKIVSNGKGILAADESTPSMNKKFDAINYEANEICSPACKLGQEMQVSVFKFLKEPLIRKYGKDFYNELEEVDKVL